MCKETVKESTFIAMWLATKWWFMWQRPPMTTIINLLYEKKINRQGHICFHHIFLPINTHSACSKSPLGVITYGKNKIVKYNGWIFMDFLQIGHLPLKTKMTVTWLTITSKYILNKDIFLKSEYENISVWWRQPLKTKLTNRKHVSNDKLIKKYHGCNAIQ